MTEISRTLGPTLEKLRAEAGLSLMDVAKQVGCCKTHIWQLEKGSSANPSLKTLLGLSRLYGVTVGYLVGEYQGADMQAIQAYRDFHALTPPHRAVAFPVVTSLLKLQTR